MKSRSLLFVSALLLSALAVYVISNKKGDAWEEPVRNALYTISGDSIPDYDVDRPDSLGIPCTYYPTQNGISPGNVYNATIVCNYALAYMDSFTSRQDPATKNRLRHCLSWLQQNLQRNDSLGYALFLFHWQQPWYDSVKTPFTCGMTSGLAMQLFTRSFPIFGDSSLLTDADLLLQGYALPVEAGGFTYQEPAGYWFEEIADTGGHTPRILDGHIFALLGLQEYFTYTGDSLAWRFFQKGNAALLQALPAYDAGNGEIYYDRYGKQADTKYKRIITRQLDQLLAITGNPVYRHYYQKFHAPMERPYLYRCLRDGNRSGLVLFGILWLLTFVILFTCGYWVISRLIKPLRH